MSLMAYMLYFYRILGYQKPYQWPKQAMAKFFNEKLAVAR